MTFLLFIHIVSTSIFHRYLLPATSIPTTTTVWFFILCAYNNYETFLCHVNLANNSKHHERSKFRFFSDLITKFRFAGWIVRFSLFCNSHACLWFKVLHSKNTSGNESCPFFLLNEFMNFDQVLMFKTLLSAANFQFLYVNASCA